jgi:group I intron endonuclease
MFIYKITNKINGKIYVGKTSKTIHERFNAHLKHARNKVNRHLYDSINCYGAENFEVSLIEICNEEIANERERFWILELSCMSPNGYNMTFGGDGGNTLTGWSEEEKRELWNNQAKKRIGRKTTEETRKKISESHRGKIIPEEQKVAISKTLKSKYESGEITPNTPKLHGKDHPQYLEVDVERVLKLIFECNTLQKISEIIGVSKHGINSRLYEQTGKKYLQWRTEYGIVGPLSKPRRVN